MNSRRKKIALLVPSSNTVMENDLHDTLPKDRYTVHTERMYLIETTRDAERIMIEKYARPAAVNVATTNPDLIVFGCTSAGSLLGLDYDAQFCAELGKLANCPALGVLNAVSEALTRAAARRVAVITPYNDDLTSSVVEALVSADRTVVAAHGMGITVNIELADPEPSEIIAFAREKLKGVAFDTLLVSCTNFRSLEARSELEKLFGTPVITSNSAVVTAIEHTFRDDTFA